MILTFGFREGADWISFKPPHEYANQLLAKLKNVDINGTHIVFDIGFHGQSTVDGLTPFDRDVIVNVEYRLLPMCVRRIRG